MIKSKLSYIFMTVLMVLSFIVVTSSCEDDLLYEPKPVEGEGPVPMTVSFYPNVATNVGASRAAGNSIETLRTLAVAIFNTDGKLVKLLQQNELLGWNKGTHTDNPTMSPEDEANNGSWTEGTQDKATFRIEGIENGTYRIYAIANMAISEKDITGKDPETGVKLSTDTFSTDEIRLRSIRINWDEQTIGKNDQMFGYFTKSEGKNTDVPLGTVQAPDVQVGGSNTPLHCWLKRAASKVTIAFDPSGLHQNVNIYIHKVTIKDIPLECPIGYDNTPVAPDNLAGQANSSHGDDLILEGESFFYDAQDKIANTDPGKDYRTWMRLANGTGVKGSDHTAGAEALFFYENMQGDYKDEPENTRERYNKEPKAGWVHEYLQRPESDYNKRPWDYDTKDKINAGTYIEVEGFYNSTNENNVTSGPIIYRFMLGKNTTYNYNAQRNHHYKLTLKFKGWANQPEWHIEYVEEKPDLKVPPTFYMPYLYNQKVTMPVRWIGEIQKLEVQIVENDWAPEDEAGVKPGYSENLSGATFNWNRPAWETLKYNGYQGYDYDKTYNHLGYLALTMEENPAANIIDKRTFSYGTTALNDLKDDYMKDARGRPRQDYKSFDESALAVGDHTAAQPYLKDQSGNYTVVREAEATTIHMPLFTRAKSMITNSGYSGNNPYEYFYRHAKIRFTATFKNGTVKTAESIIKQVPRITNPKGIWFDSGVKKSFDVTLMTRVSSNLEADFTPYISDGSWSAEVEIGDKNNFTLTAGPDATLDENTGKLTGKTNTKMNFKINFGGATTEAAAVILVRYNGDKCVHRIFVRQGFGPVQLTTNGAVWLSYNLKHGGNGVYTNSPAVSTGATLVDNPLSFGSYFKRRALSQGILERNNDDYGHLVEINKTTPASLYLSNNTTGAWKDIISRWLDDTNTIGSNPNKTKDQIVWQTIQLSGSTTNYYLPTFADFDDITTNCEFGFGIFYTGTATETKTTYAEATGYATEWIPASSSYGMRGVVVYNVTNAKQLFFPFSKSGHGRRRQWNTDTPARRGFLCYGDVHKVLIDNAGNDQYRPIPYNLPYAPGAIYWIHQINLTGHIEGTGKYPCAAWDMNYFNFDFNPYTANCLYRNPNVGTEETGSDAMPIRLVTKHKQ